MPEPRPIMPVLRRRPLSPRQVACLRVVGDGALHIADGKAMRTVLSLRDRGLIELAGHRGWRITPLGTGALLDADECSISAVTETP
jgi:hypothetical protein